VEAPRPVLTIPGTSITLYEALGPAPGFIYLAEHQINYGATRARGLTDRSSGRAYNIIAGEPGVEVPEDATRDELPARARRSPGTEGLGAEDWRERQKREAAEWEAKQKATSRVRRKGEFGNGVRGYRASVLGPQTERRIYGQSTDTLSRWERLYQRLVPYVVSRSGRKIAVHEHASRAWLESGLVSSDPLWTPGRMQFQPWFTESCAPWIILEGTRLGLRFALQQYDRSNPQARPPGKYDWTQAEYLSRLIESYLRDPERFRDLFGACYVGPDRERGLVASTKTLDLEKTQGISINAETLYNHYRWALKHNEDKAAVHRAYHRILLHRFLRRRRLTPGGPYTGGVADAAERRAKLLQAHRVLVFNSQGCPVAWNETELAANGIDKETIRKVYGNTTLVFGNRVPKDIGANVSVWTRWLYEEVLELDMQPCAKTVAFESGVSALAEAGYLA